ncbi:DUF898 family protein [Methylocystis sp. SC2]|uniref:DUF898 family protein n=1 Tax=Methylocystis sp. (strain SC2) TaxID=187303 RepID=UPI00027AE7C6|nr:DUF898 family protein [Methylocystis sp. SC2]CCJ09092.1 Uncharacterized protein BN69_3641 [Methylocystis sp. SC2]
MNLGVRQGKKSISFVDRDPDFTFIASLGVAVSLLSLGVGRFWLASNLRRYLWSNTTILGHPLVYDGDARVELLHFAVGAAPLAVIGFALYRFESPIPGDYGEYFYLATAIFAFAYWRAMRFANWRYRLNHTLWRGRHFHVEGSVVAYFLRAFGWGTANAISLGLAWPSAQAALNRYTLRHAHYGSRCFEFVGSGAILRRRGIFLLPAWLWSRVLLIISVLAIWICNTALNENMLKMPDDEWAGSAADAAGRSMMGYSLVVVVLLPIVACAYPRFVALTWKWQLEGVRFGEAYVTSGLKLSSFMGIYFVFYAFVAGIVLLTLLAWSTLEWWYTDDPMYLVAVFYYCVIGADVAWNWLFAPRFWAIFIGSLTLHDPVLLSVIAAEALIAAEAFPVHGQAFAKLPE